jgi:hypothetical protein
MENPKGGGKWRPFHAHDSDQNCAAGSVCGNGRGGVFGAGGKNEKGDGETDRRLRAVKRPLRVRLRSIQLVYDVYLQQRPIDADTVLALL